MMTDYQRVIHTLKYARRLPDGSHRETWDESVDRLTKFLMEHIMEAFGTNPEAMEFLLSKAMPMVRDLKVMPSMRLLASAGPAATRENLTAFNCMFLGIDSLNAFSRLMYALMCGAGVGFSVEPLYIDQLPEVAPEIVTGSDIDRYTFEDSREGWALGFTHWLTNIVNCGYDLLLDYSKIRPKGSPLKITGGYASGPEPLRDLVYFTKEIVYRARGRRLTSLEVYDICTKIADVVVMGGVRRAATICLFDGFDLPMYSAKSNVALASHPHRANSNNSAVFETPEAAKPWLNLLMKLARETGEPGCVIKSTLKERLRDSGRSTNDDEIGLNPCGEIILRSNQVCNLTEVVLRPEYSLDYNMEQIEVAVFLGILQSHLTKFNELFLRKTKENTEEERLLGVSLTGLYDDPGFLTGEFPPGGLIWLREYAHLCAEYWAEVLGVEVPKAITTVKPSGSVSKLVDCSPGMHPRFSHRYLSNLGVPKDSPLGLFLRDHGVPLRHETPTHFVFSFYQEAPPGALVSEDLTAVDHFKHLLLVNEHWCDHNASCTIYVGPEEWPEIEALVSENLSKIAGVTFLSRFEGIEGIAYMPLEALHPDEALVDTPPLPWDIFSKFYDKDSGVDPGARELACMGGSCAL